MLDLVGPHRSWGKYPNNHYGLHGGVQLQEEARPIEDNSLAHVRLRLAENVGAQDCLCNAIKLQGLPGPDRAAAPPDCCWSWAPPPPPIPTTATALGPMRLYAVGGPTATRIRPLRGTV